MKRIMLLSLCMLLCGNGFTQNVRFEGGKISEINQQITVSFAVVADKIKSNERLTLTPVLYKEANNQKLRPIVISGRKRLIVDKRHAVVQGIKTVRNQCISYVVSVPYESWMVDASLRVDCKIENCCTEQMLASESVVIEKPVRCDVMPVHIELSSEDFFSVRQEYLERPFLSPMSEYLVFKNNFDMMRAEGSLLVRFKQGESVIDPLLENNAQSLGHVINVLEAIARESSVSVGKILLAGSSSPEGLLTLNEQLAHKRVEILRDYLKNKTTLDLSQIESHNLGEDWLGLRKMVERSDMQYKAEVLKIIDNVPVLKGREKQLMDLKWGRPYNYMLKHFFPQLRGVGYIRIFYKRESSIDLLDTNEAIELYNNRQYRDVLARLEQAKPTAVTEHLRGVCYMMTGELDKSEFHLSNALKLGSKQVVGSLEQLEKLRVK